MKTEAQILVLCGYASSYGDTWNSEGWANGIEIYIATDESPHYQVKRQTIDPYADTLEGRRQADAIEMYLVSLHIKLWRKSINETNESEALTMHQWRLDRIKYCCEQIGEV